LPFVASNRNADLHDANRSLESGYESKQDLIDRRDRMEDGRRLTRKAARRDTGVAWPLIPDTAETEYP